MTWQNKRNVDEHIHRRKKSENEGKNFFTMTPMKSKGAKTLEDRNILKAYAIISSFSISISHRRCVARFYIKPGHQLQVSNTYRSSWRKIYNINSLGERITVRFSFGREDMHMHTGFFAKGELPCHSIPQCSITTSITFFFAICKVYEYWFKSFKYYCSYLTR